MPRISKALITVRDIARSGYVQLSLSTQKGPAEAVDDSHHRIQRIQQSPLLRDDAAAESHGRDVHAKLDNEGDDIAEVAIFDIQRRQK